MAPIIKIIATIAVITLCVIPFTLFSEPDTLQELTTEKNIEPETITYEDAIAIDQSELQLNHEVIQYKIVFHDNVTVEIDGCIKYIIRDLKSVAYLFYLTDGKKKLINYSFMIHTPAGIILDITTRRNNFKIGKFLYKIIPIGNRYSFDKTLFANSGDNWYITIGIYRSIKEEEVFLNLKANKSCLELIPLERHSNIDYFVSWDNDFSGTYFGFKFIMPFFGFSFANVEKTVTTTRGSIVSFLSTAHRRGKTVVKSPDGTMYVDNRRALSSFLYEGNQTGTWALKASGIGFPWKHIVMLFYVDANPFIEESINPYAASGISQFGLFSK